MTLPFVYLLLMVHLLRASLDQNFDWKDGLNLESLLTEDEIMVRNLAAQYCTEKLKPRVLKGVCQYCKSG